MGDEASGARGCAGVAESCCTSAQSAAVIWVLCAVASKAASVFHSQPRALPPTLLQHRNCWLPERI